MRRTTTQLPAVFTKLTDIHSSVDTGKLVTFILTNHGAIVSYKVSCLSGFSMQTHMQTVAYHTVSLFEILLVRSKVNFTDQF